MRSRLALNDGMGREGRVILGGDASFSLIHRRLSADEQRLRSRFAVDGRDLARHGESDERRRADRDQAIVAGGGFRAADVTAVGERGGVVGAVVEEALLARLNLKLGDVIRIGETNFACSRSSSTDRLATGMGLGSRALISQPPLTHAN